MVGRGAVEQLVNRGDDGFFGGTGDAALGDDVVGVAPGGLAERRCRCAQLTPPGGDPAAVVVIAHPHAGDVVGVVMHHPPIPERRDPGRLAAVGIEFLAVGWRAAKAIRPDKNRTLIKIHELKTVRAWGCWRR